MMAGRYRKTLTREELHHIASKAKVAEDDVEGAAGFFHELASLRPYKSSVSCHDCNLFPRERYSIFPTAARSWRTASS